MYGLFGLHIVMRPDGCGIGVFDPAGRPIPILEAPMAARQDLQVATESRQLASALLVAHVRFASTGGLIGASTESD